jgi:hypothetical protein
VRLLICFSVLTFSASIACPQQHPCTDAEALRADTKLDTLRNWDSLYRSYKLYRQCDDGAIGEGYSESVVRILADHWNTLSRLVTLSRRDPRFRQFVLRHVDATTNPDDLKKIRINASTQCQPGLSAICADLAKRADAAIKEGESYGVK